MTGITAAVSARKQYSGVSGPDRETRTKMCCIFTEDEPDELRRAGIDPEKMGYLSGRERRLILRRAGLDPDKYDF